MDIENFDCQIYHSIIDFQGKGAYILVFVYSNVLGTILSLLSSSVPIFILFPNMQSESIKNTIACVELVPAHIFYLLVYSMLKLQQNRHFVVELQTPARCIKYNKCVVLLNWVYYALLLTAAVYILLWRIIKYCFLPFIATIV